MGREHPGEEPDDSGYRELSKIQPLFLNDYISRIDLIYYKKKIIFKKFRIVWKYPGMWLYRHPADSIVWASFGVPLLFCSLWSQLYFG